MNESVFPLHYIFRGDRNPHSGIEDLPPAPPWRRYGGNELVLKGEGYEASSDEIEAVNAAMLLRRPLLIEGKAGLGKSTLAHAIAYELGLGDVLTWAITTRTTLREGQYSYDAIGRLHEEARLSEQRKNGQELAPTDIGRFVRLGPLGTAMLGTKHNGKTLPRVLLIDEIDKSDIDLPNDLLNIFEEGRFEVAELARLPPGEDRIEVLPYDRSDATIVLERGVIAAEAFPIIVMTSNGEREFPPAFLRRCLRLRLQYPDLEKLKRIVRHRLNPPGELAEKIDEIVRDFVERRDGGKDLSTDQLLNAVDLLMKDVDPLKRRSLLAILLQPLTEA